jgi:DNA-binding CsgD family transcriptional regulator
LTSHIQGRGYSAPSSPSVWGARSDPQLIGRENELGIVRAFLENVGRGAALALSGDAGVGKTVMLDAAAAFASADGFRVLRAVGAEFETELSFSGLHQILSPLLSSISGVESLYQDALRVALGFKDGPRPDQLVISNAVMALLGKAALRRPLLVIIDDAQWLDQASMAVLAFAARRGVAGVGFLCAIRSGHDSPMECCCLPTQELRPISDDAAAALLDSRLPTLAPRVRKRLIAEAAGNPLALMELPTVLSAHQLAALEVLPSSLPLTVRLKALFEARIVGLPKRTRWVLLLAALDSAGDLRVLQAAADTSQVFDDLAPADRDRLIVVDDANHRVNCQHPLIRSSVVALSTGAERRKAHRALATAMLDQPDRHAWHLAEASLEPDEQVAGMLDQVAYRMLHRGDLVGAATSSTRAASLSPKTADRARRLAFAAYQGARSGEPRTGSQLRADARQADPEFTGSLRDAVIGAVLLLSGDGDIVSAHELLIDALRSHGALWDAQDKSVTEALHTLALVCWFGGNAELWESYEEAVSRLTPPVPADFLLRHTVLADPARATASSLSRFECALEGLRKESDPTTIVRISGSARYLDRHNLRREPLQRILQESAGAGEAEVCALRDLALDCFLTGQWVESERQANEGLARALEQQHQLRAGEFRYVLALLAAARGDDDSNRAQCDELTSVAHARSALTLQYGSLRARALAEIGRGDFEQAYRHAAAISPPGKFASHVGEALFVCMDLVEAAVRTNRLDDAKAHVAAMGEEGIAALSPRLALLVAGSAALVAPDNVAAELFEHALGLPQIERWPFDRARVQLAYGERLRRTRSTMLQSRTQLSATLDAFNRLGAHPWVRRAGNELRATGETRLTGVHLDYALTPQQHEITALAASGLSNKQIAERLYLSPRTVGNHLHRAYSKLGITSRAALRDALTSKLSAAPEFWPEL